MKDQLVHIMKYSIIGGNTLAIVLSSIWILFKLREISFGKFNSPSRGDVIFNLVKSIAYFLAAYVSYNVYEANDNINAHVIYILEIMIKKDKE